MTDAPKIVPTEAKAPVVAEETKKPEAAGPMAAAKTVEAPADAKK